LKIDSQNIGNNNLHLLEIKDATANTDEVGDYSTMG
jgi:hypothetical protein